MENGGRKKYITKRNGRSSWERQGIVAFCTCQWNEWMNESFVCVKFMFQQLLHEGRYSFVSFSYTLVAKELPIICCAVINYLTFVDPCIVVQFIKNSPTRCNNVSKFYYSIFTWSSACFGRHTARHQEPKTALAASGFSYMEGCWTCSCAWQRPPTTRPTTFDVWKTRGCQCSFRLLMMGGVLLEICWASRKYGIIKFWYVVASCWILLYEL